jgi:ATP/maltotriose-dependent transcriptional regulator MalT
MPAGARGELHARAARALHAEGAGAEAVAAHLLAADPVGDGWAAQRLVEAGNVARDRGAAGAAVRYLRRALEEPIEPGERAGILLGLGTAEARLRAPEAADHLRAALDQSPPGPGRVAAAGELAQDLALRGMAPEGVAVLDRLIDDLPDRTSDLAIRLEAQRASLALMSRETAASAGPSASEFLDLAGDRPAARAMLAVLANLAFMEGSSAARTAALAERALGGGALLRDLTADAPLYYYPAFALTASGRQGAARAALDAAVEDARSRGSPLGFAIASCHRAMALLQLGLVRAAGADAASAIAAGGDEWPLSVIAHKVVAEVCVERGDLAGAEAAVADAVRQRVPDDLVLSAFPLVARARLRMAQGRGEEALADWRACGERLAPWAGLRASVLPWPAGSAEALAALGRLGEARAVAADELTAARRFGAPDRLAAACRVAGGAVGPADALPLLEEAAALVADGSALLEEAKALIALGGALRRLGRDREAREPLRRALDVAHRGGAIALRERARTALIAAGGRPRRYALTGRDALTPSEQQVATMAAEGMSNRAIAQALFLTQKTVERHLSGCYRKLSIASRDELAGALHGGRPPRAAEMPVA